MRTSKEILESNTRVSVSSDLIYTTDNLRYNNEVTSPTTLAMVVVGGYSIFISTGGGRTGSYSMTSRQESYRTLNSSFQNRQKTR